MNAMNGVDVSQLRDFKSSVEETPEKGQIGFHVTSRWSGQTRMEAEVSAFSVAGNKIERSFKIVSDEPPELLGADSAPNPQELLMAAVNACMMVGYVAAAADRGIELQKLEIDTEGQLDVRGFLGIDPDIPAGYESLDYVVTIQAENATRNQLEELHEHVRRTSPNYYNMTNVVAMNGELVVENETRRSSSNA